MFLNAPEIINIFNNLGDAESLIPRSATTTNQRLNTEERAHLEISDSMVHLSIGIEGADDLALAPWTAFNQRSMILRSLDK